MGRLIDSDKLKEEFTWCMEQASRFNKDQWKDVIERVENAPTVYAVEVVRCCQCRWFDQSDVPSTVFPMMRRCKVLNMAVNIFDYCSQGELKYG